MSNAIYSNTNISYIDLQNQLLNLSEEIKQKLPRCNGFANLHTLLAGTYICIGKNLLALSHSKIATELDPSSWESNHTHGTALLLTGEFKQGISYLEKSISLNPENNSLLLNLCSSYELVKEFKKAIATCTDVININNPELSKSAYYIRGLSYKFINQKENAERDFKKAKELGFDGGKYYSQNN